MGSVEAGKRNRKNSIFPIEIRKSKIKNRNMFKRALTLQKTSIRNRQDIFLIKKSYWLTLSSKS